jgi:6-phosphogluconolactonase (cycloisomerase 2 family)
VSGSPFPVTGRLLAIAGHPSGKFVYVASNDGSLAAFTVDSLAGTLTPVSGSPYTISGESGGYFPAPTILSIDPTGKYLYAAGGSQLYGFAIDSSSGALSAIAGSPFTASSASAVAVDPSGHYLVTSSGSESWVYAIDSSTGVLTASGSGVSGCGGNRMTFEPSGHFLYGAVGGSGISACSFSSGALSVVSGSPLASTSGANFAGIAAHPSGSFLYATDITCVDGGSSNRLYGYVIDPSTGALTAIDGSPFALPGSTGCYYDEDVAAEASGNFVYTVDANYGTATY